MNSKYYVSGLFVILLWYLVCHYELILKQCYYWYAKITTRKHVIL
jgi:hypothetical protein